MATALPGDICVGQHSVCLVRAARLGDDCTPLGGEDNGIITTGIVTATATVETLEGQNFEPTNGCGDIGWTYSTRDKIRRFSLSGSLLYHDHELMELIFGGTLLVGDTGTPFAGDTIGWAAPNYTEEAPNPVYLEFIVKTAGQGVGDCGNPGDPFPAYVGHIFGRASLVPGDRTFENDVATLDFNGFSEANPNLGDGPWNDYPASGDIPNSGHVEVSYSADQYAAMLDLAACGYQTTPSQST